MKKNALVRIIIYSIITVLLVGVMIFGINSNGDLNNVMKIQTKSYDESGYDKVASQSFDYKENQVKSLDVDWTAGKVIIKNDPAATKISVSESGKSKLDDDDLMRYKLENDGTLSIKYKKSDWNFSLNGKNVSKELNIVLPTKVYDKIDVDTVSAKLEIDGIEAKELNLDTTSGTMDVKNSKAPLADCESVSGDIQFTKTDVEKLDCENTSGTITFDGSVKSEIDMDTTSGTVKITSTKCPEKIDANSISGAVNISIPKDSQFTADISAVSGSFSSNFSTTKNGSNYVCGNGSAQFSFDAVSGGVTINSL